MRIAVIGSGYVGLVAGTCFADMGHEVILVDNDREKVAALEAGKVPIHEKLLPELLARHRGKGLRFSEDLAGAVEQSAAVFIAVGTPSTEHGEADLSYVETVARGIARAIKGYTVVVEKSTVPVYTSEWIRRILLRNAAAPDQFDVASNPEFMREGTAVVDFLYPDRILLGANSERSATVLREIYAPMTNGSYYRREDAVPGPESARIPPPMILTSTQSAEIIKHACNAFLAMKISYINAVAGVCDAVGADIEEVREGMGSDHRIGPSFLHAGIGYGGSCFPKDLKAFRAVARERGYEFKLLDEVMKINEDQRENFVKKVRNALWTLRGKRLAVLGLAFKGGTDDIRESPAMALVERLAQEGCQIAAYDPAAMERARAVLTSGVEYASNPYEAARGADALLILTDWEEFCRLDWKRMSGQLKDLIVIDGRNLYHPATMAEKGFTYYSMGRPLVAAEDAAETVPARKRGNS
jgi:UDPglucose 6-dehydrogenase